MIKASRFMNEKDPHSTAVMLLLQPGRVSWGHCGDSRLYRFKNGAGLSHHRPFLRRAFARHRQGDAGAVRAVHPNRNILLTSLGGRDEPRFWISARRPTSLAATAMCCVRTASGPTSKPDEMGSGGQPQRPRGLGNPSSTGPRAGPRRRRQPVAGDHQAERGRGQRSPPSRPGSAALRGYFRPRPPSRRRRRRGLWGRIWPAASANRELRPGFVGFAEIEAVGPPPCRAAGPAGPAVPDRSGVPAGPGANGRWGAAALLLVARGYSVFRSGSKPVTSGSVRWAV